MRVRRSPGRRRPVCRGTAEAKCWACTRKCKQVRVAEACVLDGRTWDQPSGTLNAVERIFFQEAMDSRGVGGGGS